MHAVQTLPGRDAAAALLRWWRDAGVDVLVEDDARGWLRASNPLPTGERDGREATRERGSAVDSPSPGVAPLRHPLPGGERVEEALPAALPDLLSWLATSPDAPEARWGGPRLLPGGDAASGLMILTDMPEPDDAAAGRLLSGEVGALFDRMLAAIGQNRETLWLAPIATVRKVGRLTPDECARLTAIAHHQIALVAPKRLLIMGKTPCELLIGPDWAAGRGEYQILNLGALRVEAVATFHPRLLLERPKFKAEAWKDLQLLTKGLA